MAKRSKADVKLEEHINECAQEMGIDPEDYQAEMDELKEDVAVEGEDFPKSDVGEQTASTTPEDGATTAGDTSSEDTELAINEPVNNFQHQLDGISRRHHERLNITAGSKEMTGPDVSSPDSLKAHNDCLKELSKRWLQACEGINKDCQILIGTIRCIEAERCIDIHEIVNRVAESLLTDKERAARDAARQAQEKSEAKKRGDLDGQMKLKFDDGSTAEPASECITRPLTEDGDLESATEAA